MTAQMEQLKMDVSCSPLCCTMHRLCDTFCFCICLLVPHVSPLNLEEKMELFQRFALAEAVACVCILTSLELNLLTTKATCKAALNFERLTAWFNDRPCTVDKTVAALPHLVHADSTVVTSGCLCVTESLM